MIAEIIIPTIANLANDPIPNIRFNVAKSFEQLIPLMKTPQLQKAKEEIVKPTLMKLRDDTDNDVKFFANRALSVGKLLLNNTIEKKKIYIYIYIHIHIVNYNTYLLKYLFIIILFTYLFIYI